ncbi:MAG: methyltransferase domain-containing protein [Candidatus Eremiobacteraeota bacterium]|nr:methyltransferase domain-containing protein [Candidatus Eremiobacteraeota bacterium]
MQRLVAREMMDDDQGLGSVEEWRSSLRDLDRVNRFLGGWTSLFDAVGRLPELPRRLLDVGTGDGALPEQLLGYLAQRGVNASCVALDRSERILSIARERLRDRHDISLVLGDARRLPFGMACFDLATLNLSLHHFEPAEAVAVLRELARVARHVIVNDLRRSRLAWAFARTVFPLFTRNRFTRNDAPLSVLRSYLPHEAAELARQAGWQRLEVRKHRGYRMTLVGGAA